MKKCIFCKIYKKKDGVIYENKFFYARFDCFPVSPGHMEIIPVRHIASLSDLVKDEWCNLKPTYADVLNLIEGIDLMRVYEDLVNNPVNESSKRFGKKALKHFGLGKKPDGYNIGINEGRAAGRTVDHLHIHVIPRYFGDVLDPRGGVRHVIPWMGYY